MLAVSGVIDESIDRGEFDDWYDNVHLPEILGCPGFQWGVRYEAPSNPPGEHAFLTLYALEGPEAVETEEFTRRRGWGPFKGHVEFTTRLLRRHETVQGEVPR
jgi:hypothetical protein